MSHDGALARKVQELIDKQEIRDVLARYCRGVDRRDKSLILSVYHANATDDYGTFRGGPQELLQQNAAEPPGATVTASTHFVGNMLIQIDGETAAAETYFLAIQERSIAGSVFTRVRAGRYVDALRKSDGVWRIASRKVVDDWSRMDEVAGPAFQTGRHRGQRTAADPSYELAALKALSSPGTGSASGSALSPSARSEE